MAYALGYKKTRAAYLALVIAFYVSIPVTFEADVVAMLLHGYGPDVALGLFKSAADPGMQGQWDQAYNESFWLIHYLVVAGFYTWIAAFFFSIAALFMCIKRGVTLAPYILDYVTLFFSSIMMVPLLLILVPGWIYGRGHYMLTILG